MWHIQNLEKRDVTLDFSSAGLGPFSGSALLADDTTIVNATTLVELEDDGCAQVIVCEECGTVHCEPGGWIQPRRFGSAIVWLPCFDRLDDDRAEYRPPDFFKARGVPFFDSSAADRLGVLLPLFRPEVAPPLTLRETVLLAQWLAPWQVLGKPGDPVRLKRELVVATSDGELAAVVEQLELLLHGAVTDSSPVRPEAATLGPELYLDGPGRTPTWGPMVIDALGKPRLSVDGVAAVVGDPRG